MNRSLRPTLLVGLATLLLMPLSALAQSQDADDLPPAGEPLAPGRYVSDALGPILDFRVADGWRAGPDVEGPIITLESTSVPGGVLTITVFAGEVFSDSCDPTSLTSVETTLQRAAEVIGANLLLRVAPPVITDVDGNRAVQLDLGVPRFEDCSLPFLLLWAVPGLEQGEFVQVPDQQSRFILADVSGDIVVIAIETFPGVPFGSVLDASMEIVDSMRITPLAEVVPSPVPTAAPAASVMPSAPPTQEPTAAPRTPTPLATDSPDA